MRVNEVTNEDPNYDERLTVPDADEDFAPDTDMPGVDADDGMVDRFGQSAEEQVWSSYPDDFKDPGGPEQAGPSREEQARADIIVGLGKLHDLAVSNHDTRTALDSLIFRAQLEGLLT